MYGHSLSQICLRRFDKKLWEHFESFVSFFCCLTLALIKVQILFTTKNAQLWNRISGRQCNMTIVKWWLIQPIIWFEVWRKTNIENRFRNVRGWEKLINNWNCMEKWENLNFLVFQRMDYLIYPPSCSCKMLIDSLVNVNEVKLLTKTFSNFSKNIELRVMHKWRPVTHTNVMEKSQTKSEPILRKKIKHTLLNT